MKIAVEGCAHGALDEIYGTIKSLEEKEGFKVDLLICCGDFQSSRNEEDLRCMAVPPKYLNICSFYKYYNGEKKAPILTIFIGGNHEASNYLQELPYGGWVAPNIYYLGYAGVVNIGGLRIGGLSGIYKGRDFMKGHYEHAPYTDESKRSVYHIRNLEIFRLKQLSQPIDIFISHDWPSGVWENGNKNQLIRFKPHFKDDIESGELGSKPTGELLHYLKPTYWFSAHLHCKFSALISHSDGTSTKFLALDKCLPKKRFLQILDVPTSETNMHMQYDLEWLTILRLTNHLMSCKNVTCYLPGPGGRERWEFTPSEEEKSVTLTLLDNNLQIPNNFVETAKGYTGKTNVKQPVAKCNPQTVTLCKKCKIDDPVDLLLNFETLNLSNEDACNVSEKTDKPCENTTFINDTDVGSDSSIPKRTSLVLPKPVNSTEDSAEDFTETHPEKIADSEEKLDANKEDTGTKVEDVEPSVKKFKRRNADMYQSEND